MCVCVFCFSRTGGGGGTSEYENKNYIQIIVKLQSVFCIKTASVFSFWGGGGGMFHVLCHLSV